MSVITPKDCFHQPQVADLRLIACPGAEELTNLIGKHLVRWASEAGYQTDSFIIESACPRFQSGDAKGLVKESVRGDDIFIVVDPGNYSVTYKLFNYENHLSPDDHFANLKRLIQAVAGKAHRVSVIMPSLYGGRQHRRVSRESLDCAVALQELQAMGVKNIITFDAHDPRLMNAVPLMSFDNAMPTYQVLKNLLKKNPEISFDKDKFIVVSPDEGAMSRNMYFSSVLGCNLGMFYKRRDYTRVVNGRNPIVAHEYLGDSVEGKTVFVADDIIASGESMLEVATNLKERGAKRIIANYLLKDPYIFDLAGTKEKADERDIEEQLVKHVTRYLLEMGNGFAFVARQKHFQVGNSDFYADLILYSIPLHAYIVVELKATPFKPEYAGQLNFYINVVDDKLRGENDNKTIGLLLCKGKDEVVAQYALTGYDQPIGISDYQLSKAIPENLKSALPSIEEVEEELASFLDKDKNP